MSLFAHCLRAIQKPVQAFKGHTGLLPRQDFGGNTDFCISTLPHNASVLVVCFNIVDLFNTTEEKMEMIKRAAYEYPKEYFELIFRKDKSVNMLDVVDIKEIVPKALESSELDKSFIQNILQISPKINQQFILECLKDILRAVDDDTFGYNYKIENLLEIADLFNTREEFEPIISLYLERKKSVQAESIGYWWEMEDVQALAQYYAMDEEKQIQFLKGLLEKDWVRFVHDEVLVDYIASSDTLMQTIYAQDPLSRFSTREILEDALYISDFSHLPRNRKCKPHIVDILNHYLEREEDREAAKLVGLLVNLEEQKYEALEKNLTVEKIDLIDRFNKEYYKKKIATHYDPYKFDVELDVFSSQYAWLIPHIHEGTIQEKIDQIIAFPINQERAGSHLSQKYDIHGLSDESIINCLYIASKNISREEIKECFGDLFTRHGILNGARQELLEKFLWSDNAFAEMQKCQEIFTNPNMPLYKKLFYFTENYFEQFFESYGERFGKDEFAKNITVERYIGQDTEQDFKTLSVEEKRSMHKNGLQGISDEEIAESESFVFKDLTNEYKKKALEYFLKQTIEQSRSDERKQYANDRNRVLKSVNQLAEEGVMLHGTSGDSLFKMLANGNLPGESIGEKAEKDFFPFHTDFIKLDREYITKRKGDFTKCLQENHAYNFAGGSWRTGGSKSDGVILFYNRNKEFDIYEPDKEFDNIPDASNDHWHQHLMLGGMPSTEISGIVVLDSVPQERIAQIKEAIVLNGFYIPLYNKKGDCIFDEFDTDTAEGYESLRDDFNIEQVSVSPIDYAVNIGPQLGSNEGGQYLTHQDGSFSKRYFKFADRETIWNEQIANDLYRALGIAVPDTDVILRDGKIALSSRWLTEAKPSSTLDLSNGFIFDCWLANHDIPLNDNAQEVDGITYRIDNGGSLLRRAQGEDKVSFAKEVSELKSMRHHTAYSSLSPSDIQKQSEHLSAVMTDDVIRKIVDTAQLSKASRDTLTNTLIARREYIHNQHNHF